LNVKTEKKRAKALALRRDAAGPFRFNAPFYPPVKKVLVKDLFLNKSTLSCTLPPLIFEKATKSQLQKRRTTS